MDTQVPNTLNPGQSLKRPLEGQQSEETLPKQPVLPRDSAITMAERVTGNGIENGDAHVSSPPESPSKKRTKLDHTETPKVDTRDKVKGVALVKAE
jgi:hypothetical protein